MLFRSHLNSIIDEEKTHRKSVELCVRHRTELGSDDKQCWQIWIQQLNIAQFDYGWL